MRWLCSLVILCCLAAGILMGRAPTALAQDSWAVYIYMCGSDLESQYGHASNTIKALQSVPLSENVKFFIQTGGAASWQTKDIPNDALGRYVYDKQGFRELVRLEDTSMGDEQTLQDFLRYGKENFPAEHRMLVFWNHGGGSLGGVCQDERYENSLSLNDVRQALAAVEKENPDKPSFDLVAFDTCLMATIETANTLHGYARYMAASQEIMPGTGTDYAGWIGALAKKPAMEGRELGQVICDTYLPYCVKNKCEDSATMSLIDLQKLPALNAAYEALGKEMLKEARANPRWFYTTYDRLANGVEQYGPNNDEELWTNMIDLGSLVEQLNGLSNAKAFTDAVKAAVVYRVAGPYRQHGWGLSGYYCLDGSLNNLENYTSLPGASPVVADFYRNMLAGSGDGPPWYHVDSQKIANTPMVIGQDDVATITLSPDDANAISRVSFQLARLDKNGKMIYWGSDNRLNVDWEQGIFQDAFDYTWPALNGHFILMELEEVQEGYSRFYSYIQLNGKKCCLKTAYNNEKGAFEILGAYRLLDNNWLDREVLQLKPGDNITTLFLTEKGEFVSGESFVLEKAPLLEDKPLPDGRYAFNFRFDTPHNEVVDSEGAVFAIEGGQLVAASNQ